MEIFFKLFVLFSGFSFLEAYQEGECRNQTIWLHYPKYNNCLTCFNISIEEVKGKYSEISNRNCISFNGGDIGLVNSDFFKQFPEAVIFSLRNVKMSLKSSEDVEEHANLESLYIVSCDIKDNAQSNALHALTNLKSFELTNSILEATTIDKTLLEKNVNLVDITFKDQCLKWEAEDECSSCISGVDSDAFDNIVGLKRLTLRIEKMGTISPELLKEKNKLEKLKIYELTEFPDNLPESIETLEIQDSTFKKITAKNFDNLGNLKCLSITFSDLEEIEENSFENLKNLSRLLLFNNKIKEFSPEILKNNENLSIIDLGNNPCADQLDLSDLGFNSSIIGWYYRSKFWNQTFDWAG